MFKKKLKAALRRAGLDEGLAEFITVNSEAEIQQIIDALTPEEQEVEIEDLIGSKEFEDYVAEIGFDKLIEKSKSLKSGHDRKVNEGINTFKKRTLKNLGGKPKGKDEDDDEDEDEDDETAAPSSKTDSKLLKLLEKMNDKIDKLEKERETSRKLETTAEKLKKSALPEKLQKRWASRINPENDIDEQIKELEEEFEDLQAEGIATGSYKFGDRQPNTRKGELTKADKQELSEMAKAL